MMKKIGTENTFTVMAVDGNEDSRLICLRLGIRKEGEREKRWRRKEGAEGGL
jgi:hypothetical protein